MKRLVFAAVVAALAIGGVAQAAEQIASPVVFGNHFQERAECVVMNAGTKPVAVTVKIVDDTGQTVATSNCNGPLGPSEFCSVVKGIDFRNSFACVASAPSIANVRGTLMLLHKEIDDFFVPQFRPSRVASLQ
jgi:hypothetical protein